MNFLVVINTIKVGILVGGCAVSQKNASSSNFSIFKSEQAKQASFCYWMCEGEPVLCNTGCLTVTVFFETPLFSDIRWRSRLSFCVVIWHWGGFGFLKKKFEIFYFVTVWARYKLNLFSCSAQFASSSCYPRVFNLLAWKPLHMVELTSKMYFLG